MWGKMLLKICVTISLAPLLVTGRPQIHLGSLVIEGVSGGSRSLSIRPTPLSERDEGRLKDLSDKFFKGLAHQLQVFLGKDNGEDELVKIHESNSSIPIPPVSEPDPRETLRSSKCENNDELMYEPDGKCYMRGVVTPGLDSPCIDDFYQFQEIPDKPGYGECYCVHFRGSTTRPVIYWKESNRCYWLYDQGPCEVGQWLVFSNSSDPDGGERGLMCTKRTCPENSEEEMFSPFPKFWFEHQGKCFKTETASPEFCGEDEKKKIYFSNEKPEPVCLERRPPPTAVKGIAGDRLFLGCKPGHKQLPNGDCKRTASFS